MMKRNNLNLNKMVLLKAFHKTTISAFILIYISILVNSANTNSISAFGLSEQENTYASLSDPNPNVTDTDPNYCIESDCTQICSDLKLAYTRGDGEGMRMITEKYPGSGDYCGY